jgi:hypothetical protein
MPEPVAIRSWKSEVFTHFRHDGEGRWIDTGARLDSPVAALSFAKRVLLRIVEADPHLYFPVDLGAHSAAVQSSLPPDTWLED